jgi:hypothetical protein
MIDDACPKPPPGLENYSDLLMGWTKWGVIVLILFAGVISVGGIVLGKIASMSRAGQFGAVGLVVTVAAAILVVTIYGILTYIVGKGC